MNNPLRQPGYSYLALSEPNFIPIEEYTVRFQNERAYSEFKKDVYKN
jgi:hypothetical protein